LSGIMLQGVVIVSLEKMKSKKRTKKRNGFIFRSIILAVLIGAVVFALVSNAQKDKTIYRVGDQAPDSKLNNVNENNKLESIKLSDLEGEGVVLNFWATYCEPCEAEMPYMEKLYPKYRDKGIEIVAVSLDGGQLVIDRFI